jgi:hypothetical protein
VSGDLGGIGNPDLIRCEKSGALSASLIEKLSTIAAERHLP